MRAKRPFVLSIILVAACKSPTPAEQMDSVQSWLGTAAMAGDAWIRRTTPDTYSRQTLELSSENVLQLSRQLLKSPPAAIDSASLDHALTGSSRRAARMARLIEEENAPEFTRQLDSLRADQKIVKQLADSIESKQ
jgi:hypothetical protein